MRKSNQKGFSIIENMIVAGMGSLFILLFVYATILITDRFFSVRDITSFDEDRKILRAQVNSWATKAFLREVYLSNDLLDAQGVKSSDSAISILPYVGSFGPGFVLPGHVVVKNEFVPSVAGVTSAQMAKFDIAFVIVRSQAKPTLTVSDDAAAQPQFAGNLGLYRMNLKKPYLYVEKEPSQYNIGDFVALSSVGGTGFGRISAISGKKIEISFQSLGVFRPNDAALVTNASSAIGNVNSPISIFYKGGTVSYYRIMFVGVSYDDLKNPKIVVGEMTPGESNPFRIMHTMNLPVEGLKLVKGAVTTIPGGTFIPFETPQQLAATIVSPSFLASRVMGNAASELFKQRISYLVPL